MNLLWSERHQNHLMVYWRGQPIYKNYDGHTCPSWVLNTQGWPGSVQILPFIPQDTRKTP